MAKISTKDQIKNICKKEQQTVWLMLVKFNLWNNELNKVVRFGSLRGEQYETTGAATEDNINKFSQPAKIKA